MQGENQPSHARARDLIQLEGPKEHPMLFSDAMVRAILDGSKTQTRRCPRNAESAGSRIFPGDRIWVRECWRAVEDRKTSIDGVLYRADESFVPIANTREAAERWIVAYDNARHGSHWRPSIFMPRWASRITLEVTEVRMQRLQEITRFDALREGIETRASREIDDFERVWDSINGKRTGCAWDDNPLVWAISFRRLQP